MRQSSVRLVFLGIALIAFSALIAAQVAEKFFGLLPCHLCILQRYGFMVIAALGLFFSLIKRAQLLGLYLSALAFLTNGALAFYQVLVERKMISAPQSCTSSLMADSVEELREKIAQTKLAPCDEVSWSLFDISMAGYSAIFCFVCCMAIMIYSVHFLKKSS